MTDARRALVVDDSKTMRRYLGAILLNLGFEVDQAEDGELGLEALARKGPYQLVLVDWDMPRMDGLTFVKTVRSRSCYDPVKLMMVTAQSTMDAVSQAVGSGVDDFLMKPATPSMVEEKLRLLAAID